MFLKVYDISVYSLFFIIITKTTKTKCIQRGKAKSKANKKPYLKNTKNIKSTAKAIKPLDSSDGD